MILIKPIELCDAESIYNLEKKYLDEAIDLKTIKDTINNNTIIYLKAVSDDLIIGFISGYITIDEVEIIDIVVDEKYQRRGIGHLLLESLIKYQNKIKNVFLDVRKSNLKAQSFYQKEGFYQVGIRHHYYKNGEDALLLRKEIKDDNTCGRN